MPYLLFAVGVGCAVWLKLMGDDAEGDMRLFWYICASLFAVAGVGGLIAGLSKRGSSGVLLIFIEADRENPLVVLARFAIVLCVLVALALIARAYF